jgi:hypothetical protein
MSRRKPPVIDPPTDRLVGLAMRAWEGHLDEVRDWLLRIGARDYYDLGGGAFAVTAPSGIRVGFATELDPNTYAVLLGFAVAGPFWPQIFPHLQPEVNRRWKAATRSARKVVDAHRRRAADEPNEDGVEERGIWGSEAVRHDPGGDGEDDADDDGR